MDARERLDPLVVVSSGWVGGEPINFVIDATDDLGTLGVDLGLVEPAEPDRSGQVADGWEAQLCGAHEALEVGTGGGGTLAVGGGLTDPAVEDRQHDADVLGHALLREEHAEHGLLERGRAVERVDAVVGEHAAEAVDEVGRQPAAVGIQRRAGRCGSARDRSCDLESPVRLVS